MRAERWCSNSRVNPRKRAATGFRGSMCPRGVVATTRSCAGTGRRWAYECAPTFYASIAAAYGGESYARCALRTERFFSFPARPRPVEKTSDARVGKLRDFAPREFRGLNGSAESDACHHRALARDKAQRLHE